MSSASVPFARSPSAGLARVALAVLPALPTLCALACTLLLFGAFLLVQGQPAADALGLIAEGAFGSSFAWQNTLLRAAPLMLTALCVALPAQVGLIVIGGEGALALGGLAAAMLPQCLPQTTPWFVATPLMALAAMLAGGLWIGAVGALRQWRGVNETISSLLMSYIAIAIFKFLVEGPLRDPASLNKPSTPPIPDAMTIGSLPGLDVHWGLFWGVLACLAAWGLVRHSTPGFAMRVTGGNVRAARLVGLPVSGLALAACAMGGASAGLAGMFEVAAVQGSANASLLSGYGYAGILVAFAARQNPFAVIVCAMLIGGIESSGSLLQRRLDLPDAATLVLQGLLFANLLAWEALGPRIAAWRVKLQAAALARAAVPPVSPERTHHA
ncbi:ABC transporter permease [Paraburkholderia ferrariae]|uniref:ABC transporter permease n=1 Tax=Paraburkholderia ferrariae TaxID=386056 RepID=UPI000481E0B1|nr:ABC transporter permease [Paraburkholderia ferrariae]